MSTERSKFLRLRFLWKRRLTQFEVVTANDGLEYVVPVPHFGIPRPPYSKLERRIDNARDIGFPRGNSKPVESLKGSDLDRDCIPDKDWDQSFIGQYLMTGADHEKQA